MSEPLTLAELRELDESLDDRNGRIARAVRELIEIREGRCDYIDELIRLRKAAEAFDEEFGEALLTRNMIGNADRNHLMRILERFRAAMEEGK